MELMKEKTTIKSIFKKILKSLTFSRKSPEGKKGTFVKSTWKFIILVCLLSGCAYHKMTEVHIKGKGIKYPIGILSVKGDLAEVTIRREVSFNSCKGNTYEQR